jgi:hypothetical protein
MMASGCWYSLMPVPFGFRPGAGAEKASKAGAASSDPPMTDDHCTKFLLFIDGPFCLSLSALWFFIIPLFCLAAG